MAEEEQVVITEDMIKNFIGNHFAELDTENVGYLNKDQVHAIAAYLHTNFGGDKPFNEERFN